MNIIIEERKEKEKRKGVSSKHRSVRELVDNWQFQNEHWKGVKEAGFMTIQRSWESMVGSFDTDEALYRRGVGLEEKVGKRSPGGSS